MLLVKQACACCSGRRMCALQGNVAPAWESISAPRHLFLMLTSLSHSVTAYEAGALPRAFIEQEVNMEPLTSMRSACSSQCMYHLRKRSGMLRYMRATCDSTW
jgi:hypothetical protein